MKKIKKIWKNKWKILEGIWYNHIVFVFNKKHWALRLVKKRRVICDGCEFLDKEGTSKEVVIKGKPACSICGCNIKELTASLSSECSANPTKWNAITVKDDYILEDFINIKDKQNG